VNLPPSPKFVVSLLGICVLAGAIYLGAQMRKPQRILAQNAPDPAASATVDATASAASNTPTNAPGTNSLTASTNAAGGTLTNSAATNGASATAVTASSTNAAPTNAVAAAVATPPGMPPGVTMPGQPGQPGQPGDEAPGADVQLSFQNAQVDMIVQWLAKHTGKSVVKHKAVQCQLTIVSSKKLPSRDALNLVYRALALEGFNVVETSKSILILPDTQDPKVAPELVNGGGLDLPEGRQRLMRIFQLENVPPADMRDKIKSVLSEKAVVDVVERANQLMVTDYTENLRLAGELIKELDVPSGGDTAIEFFKLKHADPDEITTLLTQILNAQPPTPRPASSSSSPPSSSSRSSRSSGPMPMPMPEPSGPPPGAPSPQPGPALAGGGAAGVKIWPDKNGNQLIISAPKSRMQEIRDLLAILDVEHEEDVTMRVITLENVSAEDLVKEISPLYQRMSGRGPKDKVEVTANTRSNSLIVYSSEENFKQIQKLVAALDREDAAERVMRVFTLTNADAEDVAKQLETLSEGSQSSQNRYPFYIYSFGGSGAQQPKKPSFVADRRRNAVIVQAPPTAIEDIAKLIETLDAPMGEDALAPKIFRLKYVSAVDIEEVLNELFLQKQQQRNYWDPFSGYYSGGSSSTRDSTGGKLYGKVRITSEPYSNSLIVTSNSPEGLAAVEEVLKELDSPSQAGETTMRMNLNFARANTVASSLNILFARGGSPPLRPQQQPQPQQPQQNQQQQQSSSQQGFTLEQEAKEDPYYSWLGGQQDSPFGGGGQGNRNAQRPVSDLIGRVRIVPDRRSNSILITANLHFFPQIIKMVKELDEPTPQVVIEAKIVEVASDFRDKLGVRWSPDARTFSGDDLDNSILAQGGASYEEVFAGSKMPDALRTGVFDSSVNLNVLVQFLRKNVDAKVLAEPQINIADNEVGKLFVGSQVPFLKGSLNTPEGGRNDTFDYKDVGVILEVTPHINSADEIALKIRTESSSIRSGETLFGAFIIDTRNFKTDLMVKDKETIVLGGIIQREQSDTVRKVPGLGSIPGLGWAFKKKDKIAREVELLVFLRPRITRSPEQAAELMRETAQKMPLIHSADEINGAPKEPLPPNK
jgi:type II secretion system protein D